MKKILIVFLALMLLLPLSARANLEVYFLDVGQGDSTIVLCDGESMIIDGGPKSAGNTVYSYIRNILKLNHMDYMISTHPHADHVGGLASVLNAVPVDLLLTPVTEWNSKGFENMMKYADRQGTVVSVPSEGDKLQLGGATVTILHCWPEAGHYTGTNDMSIVVRIDYGETSFLITGDAEYTSEYMMIDAGYPLEADVLKVAHHGSSTASTEEFIRAVHPAYAVISCGKDTNYGHPHQSVLRTLEKAGAKVLRTDLAGTIVFRSDGRYLNVTASKD